MGNITLQCLVPKQQPLINLLLFNVFALFLAVFLYILDTIIHLDFILQVTNFTVDTASIL